MLASLPVCQPYSLATSSCNDVSRRASEIGKRPLLHAAPRVGKPADTRIALLSISLRNISRSRLD